MAQLFLILLVLSHFIPNLPKEADLRSKTPSEISQMYSHACLSFFKRPEFNGAELPKLVDVLLEAASKAGPGTSRALDKGLSGKDLAHLYGRLCKAQPDLKALDNLQNEMREGADRYQLLKSQLPQVGDLKQLQLPQASDIVSADGVVLTDVYLKEERRRSIPFDEIPPLVPQTLMAIEDARFFDHKGIDELGILRALMKDLSQNGSRQGGSTITQQVAKNLFLSPKPTMERKLQEILLAQQIEMQLSKKEILELYLNLVFFGRNSWGIEKAAQSYFNKSAKDLKPIEVAFLIGIIHGPNLYRNRPDRIKTRVNFVLNRMKERGLVPASTAWDTQRDLKFATIRDPFESGYIRDYVGEQLQEINSAARTNGGFKISSSIDSRLQLSTVKALQDGLLELERNSGRLNWAGPLTNVGESITKYAEAFNQANRLTQIEVEKKSESLFSSSEEEPASQARTGSPQAPNEKPWFKALTEVAARFPAPLARWTLAVYLGPKGQVGLLDGEEMELSPKSLKWTGPLKKGDVVFVQISESRDKNKELRKIAEVVQPPKVNGAAIVLNIHTGRILAMTGGFSYSLSGYNRAVVAKRQPGSVLKPFTYLAALQLGFQPNYLLSDDPITFSPSSRGGRSWSPTNYSGEFGPTRPMRWALENSQNVMTARLMADVGLDPIRALTVEFGLYDNPSTDYPFILGSQEATLIDLVKAYAQMGNGGRLLRPSIITSTTDPKGVSQPLHYPSLGRVQGVDDISLFQLRYLLQGVVARGSAYRMRNYSQYVAGKTGTSSDAKDVWFIGFTPHIAIGVFVGHDQPKSLGSQVSGARAALPIFENILKASFAQVYLPEPFADAPPGVVFYHTHRLTGELFTEPTDETILEAYRKSQVKDANR